MISWNTSFRTNSSLWAGGLIWALVSCSSGCNSFQTDYGDTTGSSGVQSINGFGAFRDTLAKAPQQDPAFPATQRRQGDSVKIKDVFSLNESGSRLDALVWFPKSHSAIDLKTHAWINQWLSQSGKTLVYVVPDRGSLAAYLRRVSEQAAPQQRMEYRRRLAREMVAEMVQRNRRQTIQDGWFTVQPSTRISSSDYRVVRGTDWQQDAAAGKMEDESGSDFELTPVLESDDEAVVARIQSPSWGKSRIIVVAGGSLLTNYALALPAGESLAKSIAQEIHWTARLGPDESSETVPDTATNANASPPNASATPVWIGLASTIDASIPVRPAEDVADVRSGMEVLTTWPLSLLTIHGLIAGLVTCMVLLPIFGRPRRTAVPNPSRFGDHIDAVATLMRSSGGTEYAVGRIREYREQVRDQ